MTHHEETRTRRHFPPSQGLWCGETCTVSRHSTKVYGAPNARSLQKRSRDILRGVSLLTLDSVKLRDGGQTNCPITV